jgi:cell wall-associated NlpC family hydrolase
MTVRDDIVAEARALLGTPFQHQGRMPGVAIDCAGVPIIVGKKLGLVSADFEVTGYARTPDGKTLKAYCDANMRRIELAAALPGDVILIRWGRDGDPQHLGILGDHPNGGLSIIHADSRRQKCVIETALQFDRHTRLVAAYSMIGAD